MSSYLRYTRLDDSSNKYNNMNKSNKFIQVTPDGVITGVKPKANSASQPNNVNSIEGEYKIASNEGGGFLKIKKIANEKIQFQLFVSTNSGNTGELSGIVSLNSNNAIYNDQDVKDCTIGMAFEKDKATITQNQSECGAGVGVYFGGVYNRLK